MNVKDIRRENLREIARAMGGITALAKKLNKSQSQLSHLIGSRPVKQIGDRIAAEVENIFNKPSGWLDKMHKIKAPEQGASHHPIVPVISWEDAKTWQQYTPAADAIVPQRFLPVTVTVGEHAFALCIDEAMLAEVIDTPFQVGSYVIVDPSSTPQLNDYIIVGLQDIPQAQFRCVHDHHPIIENETICGVVKQLIMEF